MDPNREPRQNARQESGDPRSRRGWHSRGYLPHFDSPDHIQHVTVHLADSLPKSAIERVDQMIEALAKIVASGVLGSLYPQ